MSASESSEFERQAMNQVDSLYRTARRMTRNAQDAEDLVQETYLRAFRSAHTFQLGTNMRAWLFRILHNTHVNMNRAKVVYKRVFNRRFGGVLSLQPDEPVRESPSQECRR